MITDIHTFLVEVGACEEARIWAAGKSWEEIHNTCHRGDWLLWLFQKTTPEKHRELTLAKAHCAATVLHLMTDERSKNAVAVAIRYGNNEATIEELNAAYSAAGYAAADAADAASYAADAAADAAFAAAGYAAFAVTKTKNQLATADICRQYLPIEIWELNH